MGPLVIDSNADVIGKNTGFYFYGPTSVMNLTSNAKVNSTLPALGDGGILMFEDRGHPS